MLHKLIITIVSIFCLSSVKAEFAWYNKYADDNVEWVRYKHWKEGKYEYPHEKDKRIKDKIVKEHFQDMKERWTLQKLFPLSFEFFVRGDFDHYNLNKKEFEAHGEVKDHKMGLLASGWLCHYWLEVNFKGQEDVSSYDAYDMLNMIDYRKWIAKLPEWVIDKLQSFMPEHLRTGDEEDPDIKLMNDDIFANCNDIHCAERERDREQREKREAWDQKEANHTYDDFDEDM